MPALFEFSVEYMMSLALKISLIYQEIFFVCMITRLKSTDILLVSIQ